MEDKIILENSKYIIRWSDNHQAIVMARGDNETWVVFNGAGSKALIAWFYQTIDLQNRLDTQAATIRSYQKNLDELTEKYEDKCIQYSFLDKGD